MHTSRSYGLELSFLVCGPQQGMHNHAREWER